MIARVEFHEAARDEFREAARWYEDEREGLGREFLAAVEAALERAVRNGDPVLARGQRGKRKLVLRRFPYVLHVEIVDAGLFVWAVAHSRRRPGYWRERSRPSHQP